MPLYHISRVGHTDYDEYSDFIVRALDEQGARALCDHQDPKWTYPVSNTEPVQVASIWLDADKSTCEKVTVSGRKTIICASYHAG